MAQSATTVTTVNPTPPTNYGAGIANTPKAGLATPPPCLDYAATVYNDPWHPGATNPTQPATNNPSGVTTSTAPPFLDDGINQAYPGSRNEAVSPPAYGTFAAPNSGAAAEGAGTEVVVTQTYNSAVLVTQPLKTFSDNGNYVGGSTSINGAHASSALPALTLGTPSSVSGASGTYSQTVTGTGFTPQSVIYVNGLAQVTTYTSSTSLTAAAVTKKTSAGTWPVFVGTGVGMPTSATATWTFT